MRQFLVALLVVGASCGKSAGPAKQGAGSASGSAGSASGSGSAGAAADPWATKSEPKAPDTPESRKQRAEAALGRVAAIEPEVAKLRALTFDREVPTKYQLTSDFQAYVRREIAKELPPERSRNVSTALTHLGFLAKQVDLATVIEQAAVTQAGAYYDPAAKAFFLVMVPDSNLLLDTISAHELTHALQDQHFDLAKYLPPEGGLDDDAAMARRFVVEGDATLTMLLFAAHSVAGDKMTPAVMGVLHKQIEGFAKLGVDELKSQVKEQSAMFGSMDVEIQKAIDAMDEIPPTVLVPLLDSYMKGAMVALVAYEHGGWPGVDDLFRKPPESSEQVLHPTTKLFPVRDRPHRVTLAKAVEPELANNVLGELQWRIYFELWKSPKAVEASEGWGGDRYSVSRRRDGRLIGRIATRWDTAADAQQFASAYVATLAARFPGADVGRPEAGIARADGGKVFVRTVGTNVFVVDGADDAAALAGLISTTRFE